MTLQGRKTGLGRDLRAGAPRLLALLATAAAILIPLAAPGSASAAFALDSLAAAPDDVSAGAHSDFRLHVGFVDSAEQVKDLTIHLPPGLVGDPTSPALCTAAQLDGDSCPAASAVGTVSSATMVWVLKPVVGLPLTVDGTIYNLEPQVGEPARFGIVLRPPLSGLGALPKIILQSAVRLRTTDFGLDTVLEDIPNTSGGLAVDIQSMDITLRGSAGDPAGPFMRNPTSCGTATTGFEASSYAQPDQVVTGEAAFTPTGCENLPFSPRLSASIGSPGHTDDGTAPPLTTVIEQNENEAGLRDATVLLPAGVGPSNAALGISCPGDQFLAGSCEEATVLGEATAASPLLSQPLIGPVVLVAPPVPGQLPMLGLDLRGQLHLQLLGSFVLTAAGPGNSFVGLPDIPISRFELAFEADHLIASTRDLCSGGAAVFHADYLAQSGAQSSADVPATVKGCGSSAGGRPTATVRMRRTGSDRPSLRFEASTGTANLRGTTTLLRSAKLKLPRGLGFAGGRSWRRGARASADGSKLGRKKLKHSRRRFTVKGPAAGSNSLVVTVGKGALRRTGRLGKKPRFRVTVTAADGTVTKLVASG